MAATQNYASYVTTGAGILASGDISQTAPTTYVTIFSPSNGTINNAGQVERITIMPLGNTLASVIRIFKHDGATAHLYAEVQVDTLTAVNNVANPAIRLQAADDPDMFPILIPAGWTLRASINDTQPSGFKIQAEGASY